MTQSERFTDMLNRQRVTYIVRHEEASEYRDIIIGSLDDAHVVFRFNGDGSLLWVRCFSAPDAKA